MDKLTLDQALQMAESDRWYGQQLMRECAAVLAAEVRRYQDVNRCSVRADSGDRCYLQHEHTGDHEVG